MDLQVGNMRYFVTPGWTNFRAEATRLQGELCDQ
jgi:hypothetical protein